jgi:hypothetical protein
MQSPDRRQSQLHGLAGHCVACETELATAKRARSAGIGCYNVAFVRRVSTAAWDVAESAPGSAQTKSREDLIALPAFVFVAACAFKSPATAGPIHAPRLVGRNQQVENLLGRQTLMPVDVDGRVADAECFADVGFFLGGARRQLYGVHVGRHRNVEAVFAAADVQVVLHVSPPSNRSPQRAETHSPANSKSLKWRYDDYRDKSRAGNKNPKEENLCH